MKTETIIILISSGLIFSVICIISLRNSLKIIRNKSAQLVTKEMLEKAVSKALSELLTTSHSKREILKSFYEDFMSQSNKSVITNPKTTMNKQIATGRIVNYHTTEEQRNLAHRTGTPQNELPAIVVAVNKTKGTPAIEADEANGVAAQPAVEGKAIVNLHVFNDGNSSGALYITECEEGSAEGQWSWPAIKEESKEATA